MTRPSDVHAKALTRTTTASGGIPLAAISKSRRSQPTLKAKTDVMIPLTRIGKARPRKSGRRFAGEAIREESVAVQRSPPIVIAIP
jgi:hypothetical protein